MSFTSSVQSIVSKCEPTLPKKKLARILSNQLFEITGVGQKLIEIRDYDDIRKRGAFRYSGQVDTLHDEGLLPDDVHDELIGMGLGRHIGPSYLRVKGLLTHDIPRTFFGRQLALCIRDYILENPPLNKGSIVLIPNMTGGAYIGDETRKQIQSILPYDVNIWQASPYARDTRKPIEVSSNDAISNYFEGLFPPPEETSMVINFEELRTTSETTRNAINVLRSFGYNDENEVEIKAACVFDYLHPAGVERLKRLGVDGIYLVDGSSLMDSSLEEDYIKSSQHRTVMEWLDNPWDFTKKALPHLKEYLKRNGDG